MSKKDICFNTRTFQSTYISIQLHAETLTISVLSQFLISLLSDYHYTERLAQVLVRGLVKFVPALT